MSEKSNQSDAGPNDLNARERLRYQWMLDSVSKYRLFFAGLVFATLSFSVQFSSPTTSRAPKWVQFAAWVFLLITGVLALRDAGGLVSRVTEDVFEGLSPKWRKAMWVFFLSALALLMTARMTS
jgi:hypothetical protein